MFAKCLIRMSRFFSGGKLADEIISSSEHNPRTEPPSFGELDASRGMLALSHQNLTDLTLAILRTGTVSRRPTR
jgi:hypothetical protein